MIVVTIQAEGQRWYVQRALDKPLAFTRALHFALRLSSLEQALQLRESAEFFQLLAEHFDEAVVDVREL